MTSVRPSNTDINRSARGPDAARNRAAVHAFEFVPAGLHDAIAGDRAARIHAEHAHPALPHLGEDLLVDVEVGGDLLHVVLVLERVPSLSTRSAVEPSTDTVLLGIIASSASASIPAS